MDHWLEHAAFLLPSKRLCVKMLLVVVLWDSTSILCLPNGKDPWDGVLVHRTIYHNLAANAARLAKTEPDLASVARIAAGESKAVADGNITKGQEPGDVAAGLQGHVDKPRHAVG